MMKQLLVLAALVATATAFVPSARTRANRSDLSMALVSDLPPPPTTFVTPTTVVVSQASTVLRTPGASSSSALNEGIGRYLISKDSSAVSSTTVLSLKDRPPPPTPEELAAKKATFNLWFWGGGFVAPLIATVFYFGFKFWEK